MPMTAFGWQLSTNTVSGSLSWTLSYIYDPNSDRIRITHPDSNRFEMDDPLGRPITLWMNEYTAMVWMYYYTHGSPSGRSAANGSYSEWGYDAVQRVNAVAQNAAGTSADLFTTLGYNPANQIISRNLNNDSYAWTSHYAVNRNYTVNGRNQYTTAGGASFTYDANGNLTSDGTNSYAYDIENRLVTVSGAQNASFGYDPLGRLAYSTGNPQLTRFLWDGDALVGEYDYNGVLLRRYAHWVGTDVPLLWYEGATLSTPNYLHADQQGSIVLVSDQAGNPSINRYDEYGIPAPTNTGRFAYTGQIRLPEIGMYYYRARMYSPTLGRFLQTDPVGYQDQLNLYAYVGNDPINATDPTGKCELIDGKHVGVCPISDTPEQAPAIGQFVHDRLADDTSEIRDVDQEAVTARRMVGLRFGQTSVNRTDRSGRQEDVEGEMVEVLPGTRAPIVVTLDPTDRAVVFGRNVGSRDSVPYDETMPERAEHAVAGHAREYLHGGRRGDEHSIRAENGWRERNHNPFRRIGHGGYAEEERRHQGR